MQLEWFGAFYNLRGAAKKFFYCELQTKRLRQGLYISQTARIEPVASPSYKEYFPCKFTLGWFGSLKHLLLNQRKNLSLLATRFLLGIGSDLWYWK